MIASTALIRSELSPWLQARMICDPELCLSFRMMHVDVHARFLAREEVNR